MIIFLTNKCRLLKYCVLFVIIYITIDLSFDFYEQVCDG